VRESWRVGPKASVALAASAVDEPMLRSNQAIGFQPYNVRTEWQLEVGRAKAYLADSG